MATLVEQIRQMVDALETVDPSAAAEFRGEPASRRVPAVQPYAGISSSAQAALMHRKPAMPIQNKLGQVSEMPARNLPANLLQINSMTDSLVKGIIYSEILGKPVSKRRRRSQ